MTVTVAGRLISMPSMLSALCRHALNFIDGGMQWLDWAMRSPGSRYDFSDESTLLDEVQQGLHASPFVLLPQLGLKVSPIKLMTLSLSDLNVLAQAETGENNAVLSAQLQRIFHDNALFTASDLGAGRSMLGELGIDTAAVFQALNFEDSLALRALAAEATPTTTTPAVQKEAAVFAVEQARTPLEFCDYYRFYLYYTAAQTTQDERAHAAVSGLQTLLPLLFPTLDCPQVERLPSPDEVERSVAEWLARGRQIGFARLSLAAQQIAQHTSYRGGDVNSARNALQLYLQSAQAFLVANRPTRGVLGQDGSSCMFSMQNDTMSALLQVSGGVISLRDFGAVQPRTTSVAATDTDTGTDTEFAS
ncbi:hypothetical protein [Xanthomonas sp. 3058]|uniref:hypothetical protein n=1 Tax=Xanthomonas sp. 3058 TaxID=3035314 RepID=UPI0017A69975|nr:hypothetical protein [Xanthomonas sp. 3058]MBB5864013.1 hypothetical protein [Xanthomonas sp. 3058]